MRRNFWTGAAISLACYGGAILVGFLLAFPLTFFVLVALQVTWTPFCLVRVIQLRLRGAHRTFGDPFDRGGYDFALGGALSSVAFLCAIVVFTQVV
jgi:hypothetical protein